MDNGHHYVCNWMMGIDHYVSFMVSHICGFMILVLSEIQFLHFLDWVRRTVLGKRSVGDSRFTMAGISYSIRRASDPALASFIFTSSFLTRTHSPHPLVFSLPSQHSPSFFSFLPLSIPKVSRPCFLYVTSLIYPWNMFHTAIFCSLKLLWIYTRNGQKWRNSVLNPCDAVCVYMGGCQILFGGFFL